MTDTAMWMIVAGLQVAAIAIVAFAGLRGWSGWLELKRLELGGRGGTATMERIEMADIRERVRKLEAIAAGVDL